MSHMVETPVAEMSPRLASLLEPEALPLHEPEDLSRATLDLIRFTARWAQRLGCDYARAADFMLCAAVGAAGNGLTPGQVAARAQEAVSARDEARAKVYDAAFMAAYGERSRTASAAG